MPFAKKGNHERYLADANLFMEFFSLVIMGWLWLDIAVKSKQKLQSKDLSFSFEFYENKIHTMKFYFKYELPKTNSLAQSIMDKEVLTIHNVEKNIFV